MLSVGCLPVGGADPAKLIADAEERIKLDDVPVAIDLYERALDGTAATSEVHFRLGLLYLDKAGQPLSAAHHFERYLSYRPDGRYAVEARDYRERAEREVLSRSGELGFLTREEAARLKNENLTLRRQLAQKTGKTGVGGSVFDRASLYTVESGDTLAVIAGKVYGSQANWKIIEEANRSRMPDLRQLQPGMVLIVPPL